jgi:hypothetical protein
MPERNLIIIHRGPEYVRDFTEIAERISAIEPSISVFCIDSTTTRAMADDAWKRPTLTVALMSRFKTDIRRGPVLANRAIHKTGQYRIFMQAGLPTPTTLRFTPGMKLDPIMFGEYVVIKPTSPNLASYGRGIQLFRRRILESMKIADFPRDHLIHRDRNGFIVQRFIDTGPMIPCTRLMTLFGMPLSCWSTSERVPRPPLEGNDEEIEKLRITSNTGDLLNRFPCNDPDLLALAPRVGAAFAAIPVLGIDIIREERTGKLFILEVNPGGNTWHFSSGALAEIRQEIGGASIVGAKKGELIGRQRIIDQFDAFDRAAEVLVSKVHDMAS